MPTTLSCPGCQTPLRVRAEMAGRKIKCPRCAQVVTVPEAEIEVIEEAVPAEKITAEPPAPKLRRPARRDEDEDEDAPIRRKVRYRPCPRCGEEDARRVVWTFWGSFYGPALFTHVRCPECRYAYNGNTGRSNLVPAIVFVTVPLLIILAIFGALGWLVLHLGNP